MELDIPQDDETSEDLKYTIQKVNCIGACGIAPVVVVNNKVHGKMTFDKTIRAIKNIKASE
jgi:NADH-quinone oxidoreductase subunit E